MMVETRSRKRKSDQDQLIKDAEARVAKKQKLLVAPARAHNGNALGPGGRNLLSILRGRNNLYPVYSSLMSHLDIVDIIRLTRTCKSLSNLYRSVARADLDIDDYLTHWFDNSYATRGLFAMEGAILGGTAIFDFMDRRHPSEESILEAYMGGLGHDRESYMGCFTEPVEWGYDRMPSEAVTVIKGLMHNDSYEVIPFEEDPRCNETDVVDRYFKGCCRLGLRRRRGAREIRINIVWNAYGLRKSGVGSWLQVLKSSACFNLVLPDRCVSVFPMATFKERIAYLTAPEDQAGPAGLHMASSWTHQVVNPHMRPGIDMTAYHRRNIKTITDNAVVGPPTKYSNDVWRRVRRITGPESLEIPIGEAPVPPWEEGTVPDDWEPAEKPRPAAILESAQMTIRICYPTRGRALWNRHQHWDASPPRKQYLEVESFANELPTQRYILWAPRGSMLDPKHPELYKMWWKLVWDICKKDCVRRYFNINSDQRPRRRSARVNADKLTAGNLDDAWDKIWGWVTDERWRKPEGWYDEHGLDIMWKLFHKEFAKYERHQYRGLQYVQGLT